MPDLFSDNNTCHIINLPDAELALYPCFFSTTDADYYLKELLALLQWSQERITVYGKEYDVPRLSAWYADDGKSYEYSGLRVEGMPWIPVLTEIRNKIQSVCVTGFNSVLVNRYRNGSDSVGGHADDETELGVNPVIASLSFGEERTFQLKHKDDKTLKKSIVLPHGSLLLMQGKTQSNWLHQIPKSSRDMIERINLTFRFVK
ncbi:MAG: alpha-ketoglutarate-dependent dioxygenase AlkB [Gammaproteobacteria bacterium]|nr:alpha-ketoglutarate-dependent dioxygenase AlkB [Gammaproteobacteria bacterium]